MPPVTTTAFFMRGCGSSCIETLPLLRQLAVGLAWLLWGLFSPAHGAELTQLQLQRTDEGLYVSSAVSFDPEPAIEDALVRGIPLFFVSQAEVLRKRWYWSDKVVSRRTRTSRLAYQPLTRRWRVSVASTAGGFGSTGPGFQYALHQNFESLGQALLAVTHVSRWKVAESGALEGDGAYYLDFEFKLDTALLPRPFQLGNTPSSGWNLQLQRVLPVPDVKATDAPDADGPDADIPPLKKP